MKIKFIIIITLQVLLLIGLIAYKQHWVATGEKIILKTIPVDPRDIFRGDYVHLGYEIATLDLDKLSVTESFGNNEKLYVILEKDADDTYRAVSVNKLPPAGVIFIQGRVRQVGPAFRQLNVEYGIESYFIEEGKGKVIETAQNARELRVEVSLRADGKGLITRLLMDGKEIK